ncbi:MAG TPA: zinc ribbon domain-containing protein [Gemmatimonadales bacterium]
MPTYEYKCPSGHVFEKFYPSITDKRRIKCPKCGKLAERLISGGAGLVFKGSGFYATDYKRAGDPPDATDKPKAPDGESKASDGGKAKKDPPKSDK